MANRVELERVLDPRMRTLWRLLLTGRVAKARGPDRKLRRWQDYLEREGFTASLRLELRDMLTPRVWLNKPDELKLGDGGGQAPKSIKELVKWRIVLSANDVHTFLQDIKEYECWDTALPQLLPDFSALLRDTLDLMRELGGAGDKHDDSFLVQPSISEHPQNHDFDEWTALIELTRDAWLATASSSPNLARQSAEAWWQAPYPVFKRLAFFAAAQPSNIIFPRTALDWLLEDECWWLWSVETQRETMRLLVALPRQLDATMLRELEQAILFGPPGTMDKDDTDREIWMLLEKISQSGATLSVVGKERLEELGAQYPDRNLAEDQQDEFPVWFEADWDKSGEWCKFSETPRPHRALVEWLRQHPGKEIWQDDGWQQRCRDNFPVAAYALQTLVKEDAWPTARWREALQAWSTEELAKQSWRRIGPVLVKAPDDVLQALAHPISYWLQSIASTLEQHKAHFFTLVRRILDQTHEDGIDAREPVFRAINHPVGLATVALLNWWDRQSPVDGQGLPERLIPLFTRLCTADSDTFRPGRVQLAARANKLFCVDQERTKKYLLPFFDWERSENEASAAWSGFLRGARLHYPLLREIKHAFLETAKHYEKLGKYGPQYVSVLVFVALDQQGTFTTRDLSRATRALPLDGLRATARALICTVTGEQGQGANFWKNRVDPYLREIWPWDKDRCSPQISESFGHLCIAAGSEFPAALELLQYWLQPLDSPTRLARQLFEAEHCHNFPKDALEFLNRIIGRHTRMPSSKLGECLDAIGNSAPELQDDHRYKQLMTRARQQGAG